MPVSRWEQTHYSPEDNVRALLDSIPTYAKHSIDVEIYGFTDLILVQALRAAAYKGCVIRVMNDRSQAAGATDHAALLALNLPLASTGAGVGSITIKIVESTRGQIDHNKMMIVDGMDGPLSDSSSVLKGSYNFSSSAQDQDNFVEWSNDPGKVAAALAKFEDDWTNNKQDPSWQLKPVAAGA